MPHRANYLRLLQIAGVAVCLSLLAKLPAATSSSPDSQQPLPSTPREFFNSGTRELRAGKLREAEASLQTALASQIDRLQPADSPAVIG